ncbi:hypothetical protein Cfla_0973 [Cellulomonas flavigena DSM 20109]|uniref:Uncharacterized protein n=1 Tax=Cellulomonas flavigena (strain ATCC 482 / DSM 20109 / BCRC 11376 / JCM 18109 / NBRC 3775 / NCIMB 8073 / NRS 134) TaxID=446466 RepID=D5UKR1_CELFN|nr:hypothetical protein [Cellulomonas flavigena]ADG73879.1 hypothetical protein Cfla_0973 [Cellulomonas flavigena DSM 20109]
MQSGKWESLVATPRPVTKEIEEVWTKPFFFLRGAVRKWEQGVVHAPLVFASVVQANRVLWDAEHSTFAPAVLLYSRDPARSRDAQWLRELTERVRALKETRTGDPAVDRFADLLADEDSNFFEDLPASLTGGAHARMHVTFVNPADLPGRAIPEDGLLLGLGLEESVKLLPASYYA